MAESLEARFRWQICGQVQGVGFRPFVYRLAEACRLSGFVRNDLTGVHVEAQGERGLLERFSQELLKKLPPLAMVESVERCEIDVVRNDKPPFHVEKSSLEGPMHAAIAVDSAVCDDCLRELFSAEDRRAGYALTNCTACGPRYTIVRSLPYDRPHTTMAEFSMCPECQREYTSPDNRRFHAQPIACPACGPILQFVNSQGQLVPGDAIVGCVGALCAGAVVAIKGVGGFHLAVRADDREAVARLRQRKHRDAKPLAVMCKSMEEALKLVELGPSGAEALRSTARPVVLATRNRTAAVAENVAPGIGTLGVMLPYTPIQHLLFAAAPTLGPLVMTSANLSDEPLVIDNHQVLQRLGGVCDFVLWHDRPIQRCVDDSVVRDMGLGEPLPIRRARGFVPRSLAIPQSPPAGFETGLCLGGELKNTIALVRGNETILSPHLGDLKHPLAFENFRETIADLLQLYDIRPRWIACDLHPNYESSLYASRLARQWQVPLLRVQHHHAHAASLMAEYGCTKPVLAVVCDGVGYAADGTIWGGELLLAGLTCARRMAHLRPLSLAGGDAAAIDTRRSALALLQQVEGKDLASHPAAAHLYQSSRERTWITQLLHTGVSCVQSTAAGRYFDGFAALVGVCGHNRFEAEAGMLLEAAAGQAADAVGDEPLFALNRSAVDSTATQIDLAALVRRVIELQRDGIATARLALLIHEQLARAWEAAVLLAVERTQIDRIALTGGVMCNRLLGDLLSQRLAKRGLEVLRHTQVPCNDGGLALGQAAIAAALLNKRRTDAELGTEVAKQGIGVPQLSQARRKALSMSCTRPK